MMTQNEIIDLLTAASAYDNRNASKAAVLAWSKSAELGRWTINEALDAIHAHYAESTTYLMPAHVTQWIRAQRQDAAMRNPIDPPDPVGQKRLAALIAGAFQTIPDDWRDDAHSRRCPSCNAQPGEQCTRESDTGRATTRIPHPARMKPEADAS